MDPSTSIRSSAIELSTRSADLKERFIRQLAGMRLPD